MNVKEPVVGSRVVSVQYLKESWAGLITQIICMPKDNKRVMETQSVVKMKFTSFVLACSFGELNTISQPFSVQIPVQLLKKRVNNPLKRSTCGNTIENVFIGLKVCTPL